MDMSAFLVIDKLRKGEPIEYNEIVMMFILIPIVTKIIANNFFIKEIYGYISSFWESNWDTSVYNKYTTITISGSRTIHYNTGLVTNAFVDAFLAMNYFINNTGVCDTYTLIDTDHGNVVGQYNYGVKSQNSSIINEIKSFVKIAQIGEFGVEIKVNTEDVEIKDKDNITSKKTTTTNIIIRTKKTKQSGYILNNFIDQKIEEYKTYLSQKNKGDLYHFILTDCSSKDGDLTFTSNLINDAKHTLNNETFETLFHDHVDGIRKDIKKLHNIDYYRKHGLRRKKGYLFYGEPGTGKTSSVMAMANEDNRHIIEIPMKKIHDTNILRKILSLTSINKIPFKKSEIIYLFDEITFDTMTEYSDERKYSRWGPPPIKQENKEDKEDNKENKEDKTKNEKLFIDIGEVLSILDGIGNYDGMIIVATTNHKEKLPPALCREMRLTPLYFTYIDRPNIIKMIEHSYGIKLSKLQLERIPNDLKFKWSPAKLRVLIERFEDNYDTPLTRSNALISHINSENS
jgi:hypothetical protein